VFDSTFPRSNIIALRQYLSSPALSAQSRKIGSLIGFGENYKPILDVIHRIDFWTAATCRRLKARTCPRTPKCALRLPVNHLSSV
jgi:hypothetical protein